MAAAEGHHTSCGPASIFSICVRMYFLLLAHIVCSAFGSFSIVCLDRLGANKNIVFSFPVNAIRLPACRKRSTHGGLAILAVLVSLGTHFFGCRESSQAM